MKKMLLPTFDIPLSARSDIQKIQKTDEGSDILELDTWKDSLSNHFSHVTGAAYNLASTYNITSLTLATEVLTKQTNWFGSPIIPEPAWAQDFLLGIVFLGCISGMIIMGLLGDLIGSRYSLILTSILNLIGVIGSVCVILTTNHFWTVLGIFRFILGFALGGGYPLSAATTSEYLENRYLVGQRRENNTHCSPIKPRRQLKFSTPRSPSASTAASTKNNLKILENSADHVFSQTESKQENKNESIEEQKTWSSPTAFGPLVSNYRVNKKRQRRALHAFRNHQIEQIDYIKKQNEKLGWMYLWSAPGAALPYFVAVCVLLYNDKDGVAFYWKLMAFGILPSLYTAVGSCFYQEDKRINGRICEKYVPTKIDQEIRTKKFT